MSALETLRERKRGRGRLSLLDHVVLSDWYTESRNGTRPAPMAEGAAEDLANLYAARDLLKNHYLWYTDTTEEGEEITRCSWCDLPKEDIEVEGHLDGCQIAAALKEQE